MPGPCAPDFGDSNPCRGTDPALIREMGKPGTPGVPGGTPTFEVGSVVNGATPSVTYTMVNPLLYRVDYVIPSAGTETANTWALEQTFLGGIATVGITDTGTSNLTILNVSGASTFAGISTFGGAAIFNSSATFNGGLTAFGSSAMQSLLVTGPLSNNGMIGLPASVCIKGQVVVDTCGTFYYINAQGPNSTAGANSLSQTVTFNNTETGIALTVPFTIPFTPACGTAMNQNVQIFGRLLTNAGGAIPADVSRFIVRVRLDNASTGAVLANDEFTNFEAAANWLVNANLAPGGHTLYFTIQGLGLGSSSIGLTEIDCSVNF